MFPTNVAETAVSGPTKSGMRPRRGSRRGGKWAFFLPAGVLLATLSLYPLAQLVRMGFSEVNLSNLIREWPFVGFKNFAVGFAEGTLQHALGVTLGFVVIVTVLGLGGGATAAIALRGGGRVTGAILALMVFVWALPPVVSGSVWKFLLADSGLINTVGQVLGMRPIPFLYDPNLALVSVAMVNAWAIIPFNALVFRAAVMNIEEETFEAARLDGANARQEIRYVILPALRPTSVVLLVLTIVYAFRSFDFVYVMTKGGPGDATVTLPYLSYVEAFVRNDFGRGAATALVAVAMIVVLAVVYARTVAKEESQ